tara:strand:+ start:4575 stop:5183 length:609 start_codon:yes stop_codon:yes gene_type:complete
MKVTKVIKSDDYVRFEYEIFTENGKGLEFQTHIRGGITKNKIGKVQFSAIEDLDYETEFIVFGEYTDYRKFQEFYVNLYGEKKHADLMDRIQETCEKYVIEKYPKSFDHLSLEDKINMLIHIIGYDKVKKEWVWSEKIEKENFIKMGQDVKVYFTSNFWVRRIFKSIPGYETRWRQFNYGNGKVNGVEIHDVLNLIENNTKK